MPAYLPKVIELVKNRLLTHKDPRVLEAYARPLTDDDVELLVREITRAAIESVGLGIANDGEIYNPAPAPARPSWDKPTTGGRGRRR